MDIFYNNLDTSPYCGDRKDDLRREYRNYAVERKQIQHNSNNNLKWIVVDIDSENSYFRAEERNFPHPSFTCVNKMNGHAHVAYLLDEGVYKYGDVSVEAVKYYNDVRYGITKRLGGDFGYSNFVCKNPLNEYWEVDININRPYSLDQLNDCLDKEDKIRIKMDYLMIGRHQTVFEETRKAAYRFWTSMRKEGDTWKQKVYEFAVSLNQFPQPLDNKEIESISNSIIRFISTRFSDKKFSAIQSFRGKKAWSKTETLGTPWIDMGISRATYYRRYKGI